VIKVWLITGSSRGFGRALAKAVLDDPPLRLLLGARAVESAEKASQARAAEAERWAVVSRSADFGAS
jgi:NAD(P)-dependent dehydrogenase (short-subunit alcohol dehydrogenase family)